MVNAIKIELEKLEGTVNDVLIEEIYFGFFQTKPSVEVISELRSFLEKGNSFSDLVNHLLHRASSTKSFEINENLASFLIKEAYSGLFGRVVDDYGLLTHAKSLVASQDYASVLRKFIASGEFSVSVMPNLFLQSPTHYKYVNSVDIEKILKVRQHLGEAATTLMSMKRALEFVDTLDQKNEGNCIVFCFREGNKKEYDTLLPIFNKMKEAESDINVNFLMMSLNEAIMFMAIKSNQKMAFVVSIDVVAEALRIIDNEAKIIYLEHGVAPLKTYTYRSHYKVYDYSILPGDIWVERIVSLYPELNGRVFSGGYAKLYKKKITPKERADYCSKFNLDKEKKIILFAPTWSGGNKNNGIFNVRHLKEIDNVIAIPHDGDVKRIKGLDSGKVSIWKLKSESISYHYAFADLLISDISSTAIEFARIGKPVICINSGVFSDYDRSYIDSTGVPFIPHTSHRWDFCPVVPPKKLKGCVEDFLSGKEIKVNAALVNGMCKFFGNESATYTAKIILDIKNKIFESDYENHNNVWNI